MHSFLLDLVIALIFIAKARHFDSVEKQSRSPNVLSNGNQEDWINRIRQLDAARIALEMAKVDPNFHGIVKRDRVQYYEREVQRWEALCS